MQQKHAQTLLGATRQHNWGVPKASRAFDIRPRPILLWPRETRCWRIGQGLASAARNPALQFWNLKCQFEVSVQLCNSSPRCFPPEPKQHPSSTLLGHKHGTPHSQPHPKQDLERHLSLSPSTTTATASALKTSPPQHQYGIRGTSSEKKKLQLKQSGEKHQLDQIQSTNLLQSLGLGKAETTTWQRLAKNSNHNDADT